MFKISNRLQEPSALCDAPCRKDKQRLPHPAEHFLSATTTMPPFSFCLRPLLSPSAFLKLVSPPYQPVANKPRWPELPSTLPENGNSPPSKRYRPLAFIETSALWDRWQLGDAVVTVLEILGCTSRNDPHQLLMIRLAALWRRIICEAFRDQLPPVQQVTVTDLKRDKKNPFSSEEKPPLSLAQKSCRQTPQDPFRCLFQLRPTSTRRDCALTARGP